MNCPRKYEQLERMKGWYVINNEFIKCTKKETEEEKTKCKHEVNTFVPVNIATLSVTKIVTQ